MTAPPIRKSVFPCLTSLVAADIGDIQSGFYMIGITIAVLNADGF